MSELISGKEALKLVTDGVVQYKCDKDPVVDRWTTITDRFWDQYNLGVFLNDNTTWKFRLKPHTITLNGIEVEKIRSSEWNQNRPNEVILEFNNEDAARFFYSKALEIFNNIK